VGLLSKIFNTGAPDAVTAIGNVFDKLFTSKEERLQAQAVLDRIRQEPYILQAEINKIEAGHRSIFVAGWRPFIGWVCGLGFAWAFIGHPLFQWAVALEGLAIQPPEIHTDDMMELVLALLGLGALRTAEKLSGRAK
jgi:Holin of 3TMs, for gene-transfer release